MATVNQEYIKNKDGEIISPITSTESLRNSNGDVPPQIVAWCYANADPTTLTCNIRANYNIKSITRKPTQGNTKTLYYWDVEFIKPIKDKNYAVTISIDMDGHHGKEMVGVYVHDTIGFHFDCYPQGETGDEAIPTDINIIVVR